MWTTAQVQLDTGSDAINYAIGVGVQYVAVFVGMVVIAQLVVYCLPRQLRNIGQAVAYFGLMALMWFQDVVITTNPAERAYLLIVGRPDAVVLIALLLATSAVAIRRPRQRKRSTSASRRADQLDREAGKVDLRRQREEPTNVWTAASARHGVGDRGDASAPQDHPRRSVV